MLEQVSDVIMALQTSMMVFFDKNGNINLKMLSILTKRLILDAYLGSVHGSVDWYITVLKIKMNICIDGRQVKMESLQSTFSI